MYTVTYPDSEELDYNFSHYIYDHAGERTLKLTGDNNVMDVSAERMSAAATLDDFTLYPSPYVVVTGKGYMKHYYVSSDRLCARIGGGGLQPPTPDAAFSGKANGLLGQCLALCDSRTLDDVRGECIHGLGWDGDELRQWVKDIPARLKSEVRAKPDGLMATMDYYSTHNGNEPDYYFYHGDHLGSASWVTDNTDKSSFTLFCRSTGVPFLPHAYIHHDAKIVSLLVHRTNSAFGERHVTQRLLLSKETRKKDGAATHNASPRAPQELVPFTVKDPLRGDEHRLICTKHIGYQPR